MKAFVTISRNSKAGDVDTVGISILTEDGKSTVKVEMSFDQFTAALMGEKPLVEVSRFQVNDVVFYVKDRVRTSDGKFEGTVKEVLRHNGTGKQIVHVAWDGDAGDEGLVTDLDSISIVKKGNA
jgi:hypothetical protein